MFYANQGFFLSNDENIGFLLHKELKIIKINQSNMAIHIGFQHKTVKKFVVEEDFIIMDYKKIDL